jgi:signal transduction histidine kinase
VTDTRPMTLRIRMVALVLGSILPLLAFNLGNVYSHYREDRTRAGREALDLARELAAAADGELRTQVAVLQVLALSHSLAADDIAAFQVKAEMVVALQSPGANILLLREDGQQLMNTALPAGSPLTVSREQENQRRVFATGLPSVSDLHVKDAVHRPTVAIEVPVRRTDGSIRLVLSMNPTVDAFDNILRLQKLSEGRRISILDRTGRRVAHVPADELPVGQPAGPEFLRAWSGVPEDTLQMTSQEGVPVLVAFSRLPQFRWTVAVAVPMADLTGPAWRSALASCAVGLGLLTLGLALAHVMSRSILDPIAALRHLAAAPDGAVELSLAVTGLRELDEVAKALLGEARRRRDATAELSRHIDALERSNMDLDDFAYIASHDLKEPLRGIANNARFLQEDYADRLPQEGNDRLSRIGYLSQRMEQFINDLLHFSRLGHQDLAVQLTDFNEVIRDIETMSETMLKEHQATIIIPQELPRIRCDKTRITEVFRNLITNAVKYNDNGMKRVEVGYLEEVKRSDGVEKQVFYVKDNGIGIAGEFHEDIFRIFKRLNTEDDDKKGSGVGLTFVRKIVEHHGGRIWLDSTPGEGATFYFTIKQGAIHGVGN